MNKNGLIASIAITHLKQVLESEPGGTQRRCMVGLGPELVTEIARRALADPELSAVLDIHIPRELALDSVLPELIVSDEAAARWRNTPLSSPAKRCVLFAVSNAELQRIGKTAETLPKLETDSLRTHYEAWIDSAGLSGDRLQDKERKWLRAALQAINKTHVARTIEDFAQHLLDAAEQIADGSPVPDALDYALPALRLPRGAGRFRDIPEARLGEPARWRKKYQDVYTHIRPLLAGENAKGEPMDKQLRENLARSNADEYEREEIDAVEAFLEADLAPDAWHPAQQRLALLDWQRIKNLFERRERTQRRSLGEQTVQHFEDNFPDELDEDSRGLLSGSLSPPPKEPPDEAVEFFDTHRERLAEDKRLYGLWERYIYRNPKAYSDFLEGLIATLHRLREGADDLSERPRLVVRIPRAEKKAFWAGKNTAVMRYFAQRYHGLGGLFGESVDIDFGRLGDFYLPEPPDDLRGATSTAKEARSLKFEVELDPDGAAQKLMFHWQMSAEAIATALPDDLTAIANRRAPNERALLAGCDVARQAVSAKGQIQRISLGDATTLRDVEGSGRGLLVNPNRPDGDMYPGAISELERLTERGAINAEQARKVGAALEDFRKHYTRALREWAGPEAAGIASPALLEQAEAYGRLLDALMRHADRDACREALWTYVLRIGVAQVGGGANAAVIAPWQPLRLAELHVKARQSAKIIKGVLSAAAEDVYRADLYFSERQAQLGSIYYPEVCLGLGDDTAELLTATESLGDYTLAEAPRRGEGGAEDALDVNPDRPAERFAQVAEQYLDLLPHERGNFSAVLYNSESKGLPSSLADKLAKKVEQEADLRCDLLLAHSEPARRRRIYEQQNLAVAGNGATSLASEAARNFLSRLRVGFLDTAAVPEDSEVRATDLVFLQDVVARNARVVWKPTPGDACPGLLEHVPARWSRRRPVGRGDTAAAVYLAAPVQPRPVQLYLNALHRVIEGGETGLENVIPAREVSFRDNDVGTIFAEAHRIGEWVVNFDALVDRRLLKQKAIQVIRHIHDRGIDRNVVVSTTTRPRLLRVLIERRLERLDPGLTDQMRGDLANVLIDRATGLSGHIVMRAARFGRYANELIGVVLSMARLARALDTEQQRIGWYFLDDYASYFGQREERIADILAIAPCVENGEPVLKLAVSESKFVGSEGYQMHKKKSAAQLAETMLRLTRALDPTRRRIDRDAWLHRIGDLMLEGMDAFAEDPSSGWDLQRWSEEVRVDRVPIKVVGFSHVFVHDEAAPVEACEPMPVRGLANGVQVVFPAASVREEVRALVDSAPRIPPQEAEEGWRSAVISLAAENARRRRGETEQDDPRSTHFIPGTEGDANGPTRGNDTPLPQGNDPSEDDAKAPEGTPGEASEETSERDALRGNEASPADGTQSAMACSWPSVELRGWISQGAIDLADSQTERAWLERTVSTLRRALRGYGMTAELRGSRLTPNAALIRLGGSDELTVGKLEKRRGELLTTHAIEVINVLGAPGEVIALVKRPTRAVLRLDDMWRQRRLPASAPDENMSLLLGARETDGGPLYLNVGDGFAGQPPHAPHTLLAGETGSGKGVLVKSLLLDICATNAPANARLHMIDPKAGVDYPWLRGMPHLEGGVITEQAAAMACFEEIVAVMEERNRLLAEAGVSKLSQYNRKVPPAQRLPIIWLFHDELADWMLLDEYRDAVQTNVTRLGVKARAAGIRLVLITQRPDKDALPVQLRANLGNRLVLKVADRRNSELVLDEPGAERLLGQGHLAAKLSGEGRVVLAQVPFIGEEDASRLGTIIANGWSRRG